MVQTKKMTNFIIKLLENNISGNLELARGIICSGEEKHEYLIKDVYSCVSKFCAKEINVQRKLILQTLKYYLSNNGEFLFEGIEEYHKQIEVI